MIETSDKYKAAITGDARRILLRAFLDIVDPDITFGETTFSGAAPWSKPEQVKDRVFGLGRQYATLEWNRWLLNGSAGILPDDLSEVSGQIGYVGDVVSDRDGVFLSEPWVQLNFNNVDILQACSVCFPDRYVDGVASDFVVDVMQGGTVYHRNTFTGNTESVVKISGFTVYNPDAIRVTVTKWSLPSRRMRVPEILPGVFEEWGNDIIAGFDVKQQATFSCLDLPYGTCSLTMDNLDRRFEPRNKNGIFKSIEERQGIDISIGVTLEDGSVQYQQLGVFYQHSGGWKTGDNNITMTWNLVDIVGLLAQREYIPPAEMPTTLEGWVASLVAQLGSNFADHYIVDADYATVPLTVSSANDLAGATCGEVLRWACMASNTWPRADAKTGHLAVEPFWNQGNKLTLDNLNTYPVIRANEDIAAVIFTLFDGNNTQLVVSGNSTASSNTRSVKNPFIHTEEQAFAAARMILATFGGNQMETTGRGDPSSEIGDVSTVELDESNATTGRLQMQTFTIQDGVMQNCKTVLLQADGSFRFENRAVITESGTWTAPSGVSQLRIVVGGGGDGGADGTDGTWKEAGIDGADGAGGKVFSATININEQQTFSVVIGSGGTDGHPGTDTTFGSYTSANGNRFSPSYTDVANGDAFGRSGVASPLPNTGDGGKGGAGGKKGNKRTERKTTSETDPNTGQTTTTTTWETVIDNYPGEGKPGQPGASGFVVVYWDKED